MHLRPWLTAGFLMGLLVATAQNAPPLGSSAVAGDWTGNIAGTLPVVLHLRAATGGALQATLDSPAQGAYGLVGADEIFSGGRLSFEIPVVQGSFTGSVSADARAITGTWTQGGRALPLELRQTATAAELAQVRPSAIDGDWNGVLRANGVSLRVTFHFHAAPGGIIACAMDSPDQGAMGIACSPVKLDGRTARLEVPPVQGRYTGTLAADGHSLSGVWSQNSQGMPLPLDLTRAPQAAEESPRLAPARPPVPLKDLQTVLDRELAPLMEAWPQGGLAVGVLDHDSRQVMAWGVARPDSIFEIGSVTKTFTALTLAQMVVRKKVTLNEPVRELLPAGSVPKPDGEEITLLDLATQHSGLPRLPDNMMPANPADPYADYTPQRLYEFLRQHGLRRPENPDFLYSNLGVGLLGYALSLRAGVPYPELVREQVTAPLQMHDTTVELSPEQQKRFLQGYSGAHDPVPPWHLNALAGAGALRSTVADLLIYCETLMHPERAAAETGTGNSLPAAVSLTLEPRASVDPAGTVKIALAWLLRPEDGRYWHDGGTGGFTALVSFEPRRDRAIVVLYNCEDNAPGQMPLTQRVAENVRALLDGKPAMRVGN